MSNSRKSLFYALICILSWSLLAVVSKYGQTNLDHYQFLFWSNLLSTFVILICIVLFKQLKGVFSYKFKEVSYLSFLGFLGCCFYYLCLYKGYAESDGIFVLVLQYLWPLFVGLFSLVILKERFDVKKGLAFTLGFVGVLIVLTKGSFSNMGSINVSGALVVIVGAMSFALFSVLSKTVKINSCHSVLYYFISATVFTFIALFIFSDFKMFDLKAFWMILINGAIINGVSYLLWIEALRLSDASKIAPLVFLAPVFSTLWIIIFLNEAFFPIYVVGICCTVIAGLLSK